MRIANTLKRLAMRSPSPWPMLSVYVNTRPVGPQMATYRPLLKKRMAEELDAYPLRSPERESLAVDFARIQHYLDYDLRPETRAAAVFSSYAGDDTFDAVQLPLELPAALVAVGPAPVLGPLLVVGDRELSIIALVADERTARLFAISLGAVLARREVRAPATGEADERDRTPRFAASAAQAVADLAHESGAALACLGGDPGVVAAIEAILPALWRGSLLGCAAWEPRISEDALAADVSARVDVHRAVARADAARSVVAAAAGGGAALGVEAVRQALRTDRVRRLLLAEGFPDAPVAEELAALALARGAVVQFVPTGVVPPFDAAGVGALRD